MTARRLCACMRYCMMPAPSRRATMPTARRIATPRNSAEDRPEQARVDLAVANAGSTTWSVDQPSTQASATVSAPKSRLPTVERAKIQAPAGSRPRVRRSRPRVVDRLAPPARPSPRSATSPVPSDLRPSGYSTPPTPYHRDRASRAVEGAHRAPMLARMSRALLARRERAGPLRPRAGAGRGRTDAVRRLDGQGPRHPPAGARAQPAVGRAIMVPPLAGWSSGRWRALAARTSRVLVERLRGRGLHAVRAAARGRAAQHRSSTSCTTRTCAGPRPAGAAA